MPPHTTLNVNLSEDLYSFVRSAVGSGRYASASEVVRDALRFKRDAALAEVERKIELGLASIARGKSFSGDAVMAEVAARSAARHSKPVSGKGRKRAG